MFRFMLGSAGLMVAGMLALLVQQAALSFETTPFGVFGDPLRSVLDTNWGRLWLLRMIAVLATGVLVLLARRSLQQQASVDFEDDDYPPDRGHETVPGSGAESVDEEGAAEDSDDSADDEEPGAEYEKAITESVFGGLALAAGLIVLGLTSYSSHNAAVPADVRSIAVVTDFLHLLSASVWVGSLFLLVLLAPVIYRRDAGGPASFSGISSLLRRFTPIAIVGAGTLIITGVVSGYMQVTIPAAINTPYGWTLVAKLALLLPLFGLAATNSYLVSRQMLQAGRFEFRRLLRLEVLTGLLVILSVGWLAGLEPARQYASRNGIGIAEDVSFSDFTEGAEIQARITPGTVGPNRVEVSLEDRRGEPITNATDVRVRLKYLEEDLGEPLISLTDAGDGRWTGDDFRITISGIYQAEVRVVRPDAFDALTSVRFDAAQAAGAVDAIRPDLTTAWTLFALEILGIGLLLIIVATPALLVLASPLRQVAVPGAAFSVIGVVLLLNAQVFKAGFPDEQFNPFPVNAESIDTGRGIYAQVCSTCHGLTGLGDGPQAPSLPSRPADLSVHVPIHTDSELFEFIRDGIPGTAMPGQVGVLDEAEMWHLVNFLRTFEE
jgi:copper transport protein